MITTTSFKNQQHTWLNVLPENKNELKKLCQDYQIDEEIIAYSLDENERPHLDYEKASNTMVLIYNVPNRQKIDNHYETIPMTFIIKDDVFITIINHQNQYIAKLMAVYLAENQESSVFEFLFNSLFLISDQFFPYVEEMNQDTAIVSNRLKEKTSKTNLLSLSDLETGIVFFISASRQNLVLLEQMRAHVIYRYLTESEKEELEDAMIEAKQLVEMTKLASQILSQLSSTYNNVLNNNLNETMRVLTVLSVLLTIPTIITGFFGMNMPLPLEHNSFGWIITIIISIVLWFILTIILRKIMK